MNVYTVLLRQSLKGGAVLFKPLPSSSSIPLRI